MVEVRANKFVAESLEDMIVITGLPRSGTTILGKLIGSFDCVEYAFEPPLVAYLDAKYRHGGLDRSTVGDLLEVYLFYDYYAELLHGRNYNFRPGDASYILGMQTVPEVLEKWNTVESMDDAVDSAPQSTFCFKFPGAYHAIEALFGRNTNLQIVDIGRNLDRVLMSLFEKQWFFDESLDENATGLWPFHDIQGVPKVPYIVDVDDVELWQTTSPETRTVYLCNRIAEDRLAFKREHESSGSYHALRYEDLIDSPVAVAEELADTLDVEWGATTEDVVGEIRPTTVPSSVDEILAECENSVSSRFLELREQFSL